MDPDLVARVAQLTPNNRGRIEGIVSLVLSEIYQQSYEILTFRIPFQKGDMQEIERGLEPRKMPL
jgi:hypothetical protein